MSNSTPTIRTPSLQESAVILGIVLLLVVPTGAIVTNSLDLFGPDQSIDLAPADGPNGQYARIDANNELTINITEAGVNPNAVTEIEEVFTITNVGEEPQRVWITQTNQEAVTFYDTSTGQSVTQDRNLTLQPGDQIMMSLRVDTRDDSIEPETTLVTKLIINVAAEEEGPGPVIAPLEVLDFGVQQNGSVTTRDLTINNTGGSPLAINNLSISGPNASLFDRAAVSPLPTVPPNESASISLEYAPTSVGLHNATLSLGTNDSETPTATTELRGESVSQQIAIVSERPLDFGDVEIETTAQRNVTIENLGEVPVTITGLSLGPNSSAFELPTSPTPVQLQGGEQLQVPVEFTPTAGGPVEGVAIVDHSADSEPLSVTLQGTGIGPEIAVTPNPLQYPPIGRGLSITEEISIENRGPTPLVIDNSSIVGPGANMFTVSDGLDGEVSLASNESTNASITFTPTEAGAFEPRLELHSNDPDQPVAQVDLQGTGLPPHINVSEDNLNFGNVTVGQSKTLDITISNPGQPPIPLDITASRILNDETDAFEIVSGGGVQTIEPNETHTISIEYSPQSTGIKTAQLRILSDAAEEQIDVWLSNSGWRVIVKQVSNPGSGVENDEEPWEEPDPSPNTAWAEMDANDVPPGVGVTVDVSVPSTRAEPSYLETVSVTPAVDVRDTATFDMNFLHNRDGPAINNGVDYEAAEGQEVIEHISIQHSIPNEQLAETSFTYTIKKDQYNGSDPSDATIRRYSGGSWEVVDSTFQRETATGYVYHVDSPGFSQFVASGPDGDDQEGTDDDDGTDGDDGTDEDDGDDGTDGGADDGDDGAGSGNDGTSGGEDETGADPDDGQTDTDPDEGGGESDGETGNEAPSGATTVEKGNTSITFPDGVSDPNMQDAITVEDLVLPDPDESGRDGPRAVISPGSDLDSDSESVEFGDTGVRVVVDADEEIRERLAVKGANALTIVQEPIPLVGSHSLFSSKESIDDNWRMIHRVEISVPPELRDRSAVIQLRIPRDRFGETGVESATVARNNGGWQLLETAVESESDEYVTLRAATPGFSEFAVFAANSVSYEWDIESFDETFTGQRIEPSFDDVGFYNVSLTVTDAFGLTDRANYTVLANDVPQVEVQRPPTIAPNETVTLAASVEDSMGNVTINWTLPDGSTATGQTVQHTFEAGNRTIRVVASDEFGAEGWHNESIRVGAASRVGALGLDLPVSGWLVAGGALLILVLLGIVALLRRWLPVGAGAGHPPDIEVFEAPKIDREEGWVIIPRLRVSDEGADLDEITVTVFDENDDVLGDERGIIGGGDAYEGTDVIVALDSLPDSSEQREFSVEVSVSDDGGAESIRSQPLQLDPFVYPESQ